MSAHPVTLASNRLTVLFEPPGSLYRGSRFDWTTQISQITLDGRHTFLSKEKEHEPSPVDQGWGLAGEFGIETAVGFDDCPPGDWFPKIGVGLLRRPDHEPYRFHRSYEVQPAGFELQSLTPAAVTVAALQTSDRGYGWGLVRRWSVEGAVLRLETTLANPGSRHWHTEEYIHNFLGFNGEPVTGDWTLTLDRPLDRHLLAAWVDPEVLLISSGSRITWRQTPTQDFFISDRGINPPTRWTLSQASTGLSVSESAAIAVDHFNLWGRGRVVSPELFHRLTLAPGSQASWTREWVFAVN